MLIYGTAKVLLKLCDQTHLKSPYGGSISTVFNPSQRALSAKDTLQIRRDLASSCPGSCSKWSWFCSASRVLSARSFSSPSFPLLSWFGFGLSSSSSSSSSKIQNNPNLQIWFQQQKRFFADLRGNHISSNLWLYACLYHGAQVNHFTHIHPSRDRTPRSFKFSPQSNANLFSYSSSDKKSRKRKEKRATARGAQSLL